MKTCIYEIVNRRIHERIENLTDIWNAQNPRPDHIGDALRTFLDSKSWPAVVEANIRRVHNFTAKELLSLNPVAKALLDGDTAEIGRINDARNKYRERLHRQRVKFMEDMRILGLKGQELLDKSNAFMETLS